MDDKVSVLSDPKDSHPEEIAKQSEQQEEAKDTKDN
jgi:hypothetical protein